MIITMLRGEKIMYIDTHVHLNADQYEEDVDEVITRALEAGVDENGGHWI